MQTKAVISLEMARDMLDAALDAARDMAINVSVAVVDDGAYLLAAARMDGAGLLTPEVARKKAKTSALMRAPSRLLADRVRDEPELLSLTDYLPLAGGLPIIHDGQCLGAIAISGGTADQDELIGRTAIEKALSIGSRN